MSLSALLQHQIWPNFFFSCIPREYVSVFVAFVRCLWWHLHVFRLYVIVLMLVYVHADALILFLHLIECLFLFCVLFEVVLTIWKCVLPRKCVFLPFPDVKSGLSLENMVVCSQFVCTEFLFLHAWTDHIVLSVVSQPMAQFILKGVLTLISIELDMWVYCYNFFT